MRDFLWSNNEIDGGFHWVNWREVGCTKQEGGLDIRGLRHMNEALNVFAIRKSEAPMEVCFFTWEAIKAKIPTYGVLKRRNFNGPSRCFICHEKEETSYHLVIHCCWALSLWYLSSLKDVVVAWRRRMKTSLEDDCFDGVLGGKVVARFLRIKPGPIKISGAVF